jgi:hypothetical protein
MTDQTEDNRKLAAEFAQAAFEDACEAREGEPIPGSMSAFDIAGVAMQCKDEAELRFSVRISATIDEDWNWRFF